MARPQKKVDENLIKKLAGVGCSNESIAIQCDISVDTLTRRFADVLLKSRENLKTQLRIWQLEAARKGNVTMQIWLGKQMLGQRDGELLVDENLKEIEIKVTKYDQNKS